MNSFNPCITALVRNATAPKSIDLSTAALSSAPSGSKIVQGQIGKLVGIVNLNFRTKPTSRKSLLQSSSASGFAKSRSTCYASSSKISISKHIRASVSNLVHDAQSCGHLRLQLGLAT
uniref:Uncharacterized protein n=1 Tax=Physcomitrium patens TaxID=3218 RepID=A0A2K1IIT9_PHYPA|nr:hypothetical protein PHYPA_027882 [Physcomitrium patens]